VKRYTTEIVANDMKMLDPKGQSKPDDAPASTMPPGGDQPEDVPF